MVQISLIDSLYENCRFFFTKTKIFLNRRVAELFGLCIILLGSVLIDSQLQPTLQMIQIFLVIKNDEIKNLLGFRGSVVSDFFISIHGFNFISNSNNFIFLEQIY